MKIRFRGRKRNSRFFHFTSLRVRMTARLADGNFMHPVFMPSTDGGYRDSACRNADGPEQQQFSYVTYTDTFSGMALMARGREWHR